MPQAESISSQLYQSRCGSQYSSDSPASQQSQQQLPPTISAPLPTATIAEHVHPTCDRTVATTGCHLARHSKVHTGERSHKISVTTILTWGIPAFYASITTRVTNSTLDLKAAVRAWEAVRNFDSILLASLVAASFKEFTNATYWFFIACSLLHTSMGLICSTILIICFSSHLEHDGYSVDADKLDFSFWSIWDLFSLPAIWTVWAALMFIIALIVDVAAPSIIRDDCIGSNHDSLFTAAKVVLSLFICLAAARFGFFMIHLRRVYRARINLAPGATQS